MLEHMPHIEGMLNGKHLLEKLFLEELYVAIRSFKKMRLTWWDEVLAVTVSSGWANVGLSVAYDAYLQELA